MNNDKIRCKVKQIQTFSTSYTTHYFTNWYEAITKVLSKLNLDDTKSIEIKMEEKDITMHMIQ